MKYELNRTKRRSKFILHDQILTIDIQFIDINYIFSQMDITEMQK